jgi:transcriptional regulator with XRE-family HTH domain
MPKLRHPTVGALTAAEFRSELARLNLTQQWFAEQTGCDKGTVSQWATGVNPVPQYVHFILQLLDRLAYRGEMRDVESQVEAFVRMITARTLVPSSRLRDASEIEYATGGVPVVLPAEHRNWRVVWRDPETERIQESWFSHDSGAYRHKSRLKRLGIDAKVARRAA